MTNIARQVEAIAKFNIELSTTDAVILQQAADYIRQLESEQDEDEQDVGSL